VTDAATALRRADVLLGAGRFADAIALIAPVVAAEPDNSRAWSLLAQAQLGVGKPAEGLTAAENAIRLDPSASWPHRLRSIALRRTGRRYEAVESAGEACRLDPHHWMNHFNLAQTALDGQAFVFPGGMTGLEIARQASATARTLAPNEPSAFYVSGQVSRADGNTAEATAHFERALALDPEHSSAINELGRIKLEQGNAGGAARHFVQAARIAPAQSVYGHNVEVAIARAERSVRELIRWVIYGSWLVVIVALFIGIDHRTVTDQIALLAILPVAAVAIGVFWRVQVRRLPKETRQLFQSRSMLLALGVSLCSLLVGLSVAAFRPDRSGRLLLPVLAFMLVARFAAFRILRDGARRRYQQITSRSATIKS
jgi:tetratricopeptide (TPR) repeat protein